jgi:subtilase family serine protease
MKVRNGFVSNSSSSSFVVTYDELVGINDITVDDIKNDKYVIIGKYLCEGYDIIHLENDSMFYCAQKVANENKLTLEVLKNPTFNDIDYKTISYFHLSPHHIS